jgi:hypothetical protein
MGKLPSFSPIIDNVDYFSNYRRGRCNVRIYIFFRPLEK